MGYPGTRAPHQPLEEIQLRERDLPGFVVVQRLDAPHPEESFTRYRPLGRAMASVVRQAVGARKVFLVLHADHGGEGGFTVVFGRGHDPGAIEAIEGRTLVVGPCAVEEASERLIERPGRENVHLSRYCKDICAVTEALFHLMKVKSTDMTYLGPLRSLLPCLTARLKGSNSRVPHLLSHLVKRV